jgi:hypothetical protein
VLVPEQFQYERSTRKSSYVCASEDKSVQKRLVLICQLLWVTTVGLRVTRFQKRVKFGKKIVPNFVHSHKKVNSVKFSCFSWFFCRISPYFETLIWTFDGYACEPQVGATFQNTSSWNHLRAAGRQCDPNWVCAYAAVYWIGSGQLSWDSTLREALLWATIHNSCK